MNLRQLECLVRVIDTGSMTRAAEALHIAQPALGMQIKLLEEELGMPLLVRHSRGIVATEAGHLLHKHALAIRRLVDLAREDVMRLAGRSAKPLRLGMTPSLMQIVGPEIAVQAAARAPEAPLALSENMSHMLVESLRRGEVDMILAYEVPAAAGFWRQALYREDLVFVTPAGAISALPITFSDVLKDVLILPEPQDTVRALVERTAREIGIPLRLGQEMRSISGIKAMIRRGSGAGVLPFGTIMNDVREGQLGFRPIEHPALRRTLYLAGERQVEALRDFPELFRVIQSAIGLLSETMGTLGQPIAGKAAAAI
jgi:LysR family transcriptional regulator, nitrogen assimilation regulatory protein